MSLTVGRVASIQGEVRPPGDKSLTHRALLFSAISDGPCFVKDALQSFDTKATLSCLCAMGLRFEQIDNNCLRLIPPPVWTTPEVDLDCGNSGTTMRLLSGLVASRDIRARMIGDESLSRRPMRRIAEPLRLMGATVQGDYPPLQISGSSHLTAISYESPVASAQIKSCVLLAGLRANGTTTVTEPSLSRDHTERMLNAIGVPVVRNGLSVSVEGGKVPHAFEMSVPGDISSAAFWMVAGLLFDDSEITISHVGINPSRTGIFRVFEQVGSAVGISPVSEELGEPVANLHISRKSELLGFRICGDLVPQLVDEIPVLAVLATQCDGITEIRDANELRLKESDRIELMANGLNRMGAHVEALDDGLRIVGPTPLIGATIDAQGDHRIAMSFVVAGLIADGNTTILGEESIATSYPSFEEDLWRLCIV